MAIPVATAAGLQIVSGIFSGGAQVSAGKQSKQIREFNAGVAQSNAVQAMQWAKFNETQESKARFFNREQIRVDLVKSGVSLDIGTAGEILFEQEVEDELAAGIIRRKGQIEVTRFNSQAVSELFIGQAEEQAGKVAGIGALLGGVTRAGTLLT